MPHKHLTCKVPYASPPPPASTLPPACRWLACHPSGRVLGARSLARALTMQTVFWGNFPDDAWHAFARASCSCGLCSLCGGAAPPAPPALSMRVPSVPGKSLGVGPCPVAWAWGVLRLLLLMSPVAYLFNTSRRWLCAYAVCTHSVAAWEVGDA
jgi:hypothetical protein